MEKEHWENKHEEAMDLADKADVEKDSNKAQQLYLQAAQLESEVLAHITTNPNSRAIFGVSVASLYLAGKDFKNARDVAQKTLNEIGSEDSNPYHWSEATSILTEAVKNISEK